MLRRLLGVNPFRKFERQRDTDRDWRMIGETEPYFGVLTSETFKRDNLDDAARERFFASGRGDVRHHFSRMNALFGAFEPRSALDFGCGVGRLTVPLAEIAGQATGVDISPGMMAEARLHTTPGLTFVDAIPDVAFEWVMSLIVLQHIPPERGYKILRQLLAGVSENGGATVQLMFARTTQHARSAGGRLILDGTDVTPATRSRSPRGFREGVMLMHDYDLSRVIALFYQAGMTSLHLEHCDHGGIVGATIYARKRLPDS
ncbi:class I SAM-dependent methyltransferase [Novosphingobium resinovorum]|uniref:Methyltransferase domain-containing protein n=1 Tax=Novosphingobium resinovorum TaxID=158500 RepID=A0A1D8A5V5_9SPHN|nr:class I SAM-dependent methyltransferase [Novosphingobium resinovorum]AOR77481.1 hypothetical protein BES08_12475 [Novosphingobium resinovorum]